MPLRKLLRKSFRRYKATKMKLCLFEDKNKTVFNIFQNHYKDDFCFLSNVPNKLESSKSIIVLPTVDHWGDDEFLLVDQSQRPSPVLDLINLAKVYKDKKFYLLTVAPFLHEYFTSISNVVVIYYADDFLFHHTGNYYGNTFVEDKEFTKEWHWLCLSHNLRMHRAICNMLLLGSDVKHGYLRFDPSLITCHDSYKSFKSYLKYNKYPYLDSITPQFGTVLRKGFDKIKNKIGYNLSQYTDVNPNFSINYNTVLAPQYYKHSAVEIAIETVFINRTGILTEKYINTVYGANFPILIGMANSVAHLRKLGLDLFDDIVDHSYDTIKDPYTRLAQAITRNLELLEDSEKTKNLWIKNKSRFRSNFELIENMYANKNKLLEQKIESAL